MNRLTKAGMALLAAGSFACCYAALHIVVLDGGGILKWGGVGLALLVAGTATLIAGEP